MEEKEITVLFLDDDPERVPRFSRNYRDCNLVYVRTFREFRRYLGSHEVPDVISFDHDLGEPTYINGETCAKWAVENGKIPKAVLVHSWNPTGAENIARQFNGLGIQVVLRAFSATTPHL